MNCRFLSTSAWCWRAGNCCSSGQRVSLPTPPRETRPGTAGNIWSKGSDTVARVTRHATSWAPRRNLAPLKAERSKAGGPMRSEQRRSRQSRGDEVSLTQYLTEGFHPLHGVARESMAVVTGNLAGVLRQDVAAMARYLASLSKSDNPRREKAAADPRGPGTAPQSAGSQAATPAASADPGSRIYSTTCASCHEGGRAVPLGAINLSFSTAIGGESPENLVNIVLDGLPAADGIAGPIMPGFAGVLTDQQLTDLVRHLRRDVAQKSDWQNLNEVIRIARSARRASATAQNQSTR